MWSQVQPRELARHLGNIKHIYSFIGAQWELLMDQMSPEEVKKDYQTE